MTNALSHRLLLACITATATLLVGTAGWAQNAVDAVNGVDAVAVLGDRLPALARRHGMAPADLAALLQSDTTLWLDALDRLVYIDTAIPGVQHAPAGVPVALAGIELEDAFLLQTDPGADRTIYLDFDGHHSFNNSWGTTSSFPSSTSMVSRTSTPTVSWSRSSRSGSTWPRTSRPSA